MALPTNTKAYYQFENNLNDSSGNGYNLTSGGNSFSATAKIGSFSRQLGVGGDSYNNNADFAFGSGNFTVAFWVKTAGIDLSDEIFISTDTTYGGGTNGWHIISNNQTPPTLIRFRNDDWIIDVCHTADITDNQWHRIVVSRTSTAANGIKSYLDGTLHTTGTCANNFTEDDLRIGGGVTLGNVSDALIDDILIIKGTGWDQAAVTADWNGGAGVDYLAADFTRMQLQIGDAWKLGAGMQINVSGDIWKQCNGMQVNIGDVWKKVF